MPPRLAVNNLPAGPDRDARALCYARPRNSFCPHFNDPQGHGFINFCQSSSRSAHAGAVDVLIRTIFKRRSPAEILSRIIGFVPVVVSRVVSRARGRPVKRCANKAVDEVGTPPSNARLVFRAHQSDVPISIFVEAWVQEIRNLLTPFRGSYSPNAAERTRLMIGETRDRPPFFYEVICYE